MAAPAAIIEKLLSLNLSSGARVLTDPSLAEFQELLARWTDVDKKQPYAIVMPTTEDDILKIVKCALSESALFVARAGGHSSWSTIANGFILDFSLMRDVVVDTENQTATASAGTLIGDMMKAAAAKGLCVAAGSVNSVGFIPSTIGGGLTVLAPLVGYGSDNIISARLVTASGELITVSRTENSDLFYGICGAGQFFGLVLSLTVKAHPLTILGSAEGNVWHATFIFGTSRAAAVAEAVLSIKRLSKRSYVLVGVLPTPPTLEPVIMVVGVYLGKQADGETEFKALLDLSPDVVASSTEVPFGRMNDGFAAFESKGGFKRWLAPGLTSVSQFKPDDMTYFVEQQARVVKEFPDAKPTGFVIEFTSFGDFDHVGVDSETAFAHRDVALWAHLLCWATNEDAVNSALTIADEIVAHLRKGQPKAHFSFYQNFSRDAPVEERYKGIERLTRLTELKRKWDPQGVFTSQLL